MQVNIESIKYKLGLRHKEQLRLKNRVYTDKLRQTILKNARTNPLTTTYNTMTIPGDKTNSYFFRETHTKPRTQLDRSESKKVGNKYLGKLKAIRESIN